MIFMDWRQAIEHWRSLPPAERARIRRARIALSVVESMAFEREPVGLAAMEAELARLEIQADTAKRASGS